MLFPKGKRWISSRARWLPPEEIIFWPSPGRCSLFGKVQKVLATDVPILIQEPDRKDCSRILPRVRHCAPVGVCKKFLGTSSIPGGFFSEWIVFGYERDHSRIAYIKARLREMAHPRKHSFLDEIADLEFWPSSHSLAISVKWTFRPNRS